MMKANLKIDRNMRIIGKNELGLETVFDSHPSVGGEDTAPTPMEIALQAMAACSMMDVITILKKKRKQVDNLNVTVEGHRKHEHPKIFTEAKVIYELISPDAELKDLERAIELSQGTYCSVSAMFKLAGCKVETEAFVHNSK